MPSETDRFPLVEPRGHGPALMGLWRAAQNQRLPHALLVTGPEGIGKFTSLRTLAAGLLCAEGPGPPCRRCGPCKRVRSAQHPDLFVVDARASGQDQLTIAFFAQREGASGGTGYSGPAVADFLELRPQEGGWRIVLVREVERMNEAAQNAFLKTLEEPGQQTLIALETAHPARLLATVLSRVVRLDLAALTPADCLAVLASSMVSGDEAALLTRLARGAPGRALSLRDLGVPHMRELLVEALEGRAGVVETRRALWEIEGEFPGKTPAAQHRARAQAFLDLGLDLLRDMERAAAGVSPEQLTHGDLLERLPQLPAPERRRRLDPWLCARQDVALNLAPDGLVDRALAAIVPATPPAPAHPQRR